MLKSAIVRFGTCLARVAIAVMLIGLTSATAAEDWVPIAPYPPGVSLEARNLIRAASCIVSLPDKKTLVSAGSEGMIRRSEDQGRTWSDIPVATRATFKAMIVLPDGIRIIAVGTKGVVARSANAGRTWDVRQVGNDDFLGVAAKPDGETLFAVSLAGCGAAMTRDRRGTK